MSKTHWKKTIDKDWIGTYVLPEGQPIDVVLTKVIYQEVKVKGVKDWHRVAYFAKNSHFDKPMLINIKNSERIEKITGTPYIEDWSNLNIKVTLCQEMDKAFGGGQDWALRISTILPKAESQLTPLTEDKLTDAVKFCKQGKTIEDLKKHYSLTADIENKLKGLLNAKA